MQPKEENDAYDWADAPSVLVILWCGHLDKKKQLLALKLSAEFAPRPATVKEEGFSSTVAFTMFISLGLQDKDIH